MPSCVVKWCKNNSSSINKCQEITFHKFPTGNEPWKNDWVKIISNCRNQDDWVPSKSSVICSLHFDSNDLYITQKGRRRIVTYAVPKKLQDESMSSDRRISLQEDEYPSSGPSSPHSTTSRTTSGENVQTFYNSFAARLRPSPEQMEELVHFLEQNPGIAKGSMRTTEANIETKKKWTDAAVLINKAGECNKDGEGWEKFWIEKKNALKQQLAAELSAKSNPALETYSLMTSLEERMAALIEAAELVTENDSDTNDPSNVSVKLEKESSSFVPLLTLKEERETSPEPDHNPSYPNSPLPATPECKSQVNDAELVESQPVLPSSASSFCGQLQSVLEFIQQNPRVAEGVQFDAQMKKHTGSTPSKRPRPNLAVPRVTSPHEHQISMAYEDFPSMSNPQPSITGTQSREDNAVAIEAQSSSNRTISRSKKTNSRCIRRIRPRFLTANDRLLAIQENHARAEVLRARTARESVAAWRSVSDSINNLSQAVRFAGEQIADALKNRL